MTVASFVAAQRTDHGVPHAVSCRALEVPESTFYKWLGRPPTPHARSAGPRLDAAVKASFDDSGGTPGTYGSPRVFEDLVEDGWKVSVNTVAASMARQGLQGRAPKRKRRSLTRPDKAAAPIGGPDRTRLQRRGDQPQVVRGPDRDPHRRSQTISGDCRRPGLAAPWRASPSVSITTRRWPKPRCVWRATVRGGNISGVIFHSDKGGEYCGDSFAETCEALGVIQSMGRVGSALDNAAAEFLQLDPGVGTALTPALRHQSPSPPTGRPIHRLLQPSTPPQQLAKCCRPSSTNRSSPIAKPKEPDRTEPHETRPLRSPHTPCNRTDCTRVRANERLQPSISNPPRFEGKPSVALPVLVCCCRRCRGVWQCAKTCRA